MVTKWYWEVLDMKDKYIEKEKLCRYKSWELCRYKSWEGCLGLTSPFRSAAALQWEVHMYVIVQFTCELTHLSGSWCRWRSVSAQVHRKEKCFSRTKDLCMPGRHGRNFKSCINAIISFVSFDTGQKIHIKLRIADRFFPKRLFAVKKVESPFTHIFSISSHALPSIIYLK